MKIKLTSNLASGLSLDCELLTDYFPNGFIPRIGDTIIHNDIYLVVDNVVIDRFYSMISLYVSKSKVFC